ncbi:MAG: MSEP-CTERM sorting domain-containing protein [Spirochaetaceae bacterium]
MNNLTKPYWIFLINTLPLIILFIILRRDYVIIKSLLTPDNITLWKSFTTALIIYGISNLVYGVILKIKNREIDVIYTCVTLVISISIIYFYIYNLDEIIPFNIPQWMVPGERLVYVGTFLMPTILFLIFILVFKLTSVNKKFNAFISFGISVLIPVCWYIILTLGLPSMLSLPSRYKDHINVVLLITGIVLFIFFLFRGCYILIQRRSERLRRREIFWRIPLALLLPIGGLLLHLKFPIFGNFNSRWFFIIGCINGILLCLPNLNNKTYRLYLFIGRSITYMFSIYFLIVFIPYLPVSVVAILAYGSGLLMLCPITLFMIHTQTLTHDWNYLKSYFNKKILGVIILSSVLIIPFGLSISILRDKGTLNSTLNYLYSPDYSKEYKINRKSLKNTLENITSLQKSRIDFLEFNDNYIPYLSGIYNKMVFNGLTISKSKINEIEQIFFDKDKNYNTPNRFENESIEITELDVESRYDVDQDVWISTLNIKLTNTTDFFGQEYVTTLDLPNGCWISDYYLYVNGIKEHGLLAEKKSAMWIYNQIRYRERRDPGILYYLSGNKVEFKVFPFAGNEVRETGIEFIHKEPFSLKIDYREIMLGDYKDQIKSNHVGNSNNDVIYISESEKKELDILERKPYYHFIVDTSQNQDINKNSNIQMINSLLKRQHIKNIGSKISFTNSTVITYDLNNNLEELYDKQTFHGGFYTDRAIKKALYDSYVNLSKTYPIIIIVTDNIYNGVLVNNFSDLKITYPDSSLFYLLKEDGELETHNLESNPLKVVQEQPKFNNTVYAYPNRLNPVVYLPKQNGGEVILLNKEFKLNRKLIKDKNWESGLLQQGLWIQHKLYPDKDGKRWQQQIRSSFESKIMSPVTSYLVVENDAQRAMLKRKQERVLNGKESFDIQEEPVQMSEPGFVILALILLTTLYLKKRKNEFGVKI